jgi:hypothetical protein
MLLHTISTELPNDLQRCIATSCSVTIYNTTSYSVAICNIVVLRAIAFVTTLFWKGERMTLSLPKWGLGSPPGLLKLQSSILGVKTPCIEVFFISLESYQGVNVENGLA